MAERWIYAAGCEIIEADKLHVISGDKEYYRDEIGRETVKSNGSVVADGNVQFTLFILHVHGIRGKGFKASINSDYGTYTGNLRIGTDEVTYNRALEDFDTLIELVTSLHSI